MSLQQYALLDPTLTVILGFETFDTSVMAGWVAAGNPKAQYYLPVNTAVTLPVYNASTQTVQQNGWTITPGVSVTPVWVVVALTQGQIDWASIISADLVTAFNTYIAQAVPNQAQQTAVILQLVKAVKAILEQYGITQ
jgi:hypothetical protein